MPEILLQIKITPVWFCFYQLTSLTIIVCTPTANTIASTTNTTITANATTGTTTSITAGAAVAPVQQTAEKMEIPPLS